MNKTAALTLCAACFGSALTILTAPTATALGPETPGEAVGTAMKNGGIITSMLGGAQPLPQPLTPPMPGAVEMPFGPLGALGAAAQR